MAASSPMPVNELALVRLALRYDALKTYGIPMFLQMADTLSATSITSSSPSTIQGPAIKKKFDGSYDWRLNKGVKNCMASFYCERMAKVIKMTD